jgi:hypothetical protein
MILETARITSLPDTAYYIPDFITAEEEEELVGKVGAFIYFLPYTAKIDMAPLLLGHSLHCDTVSL